MHTKFIIVIHKLSTCPILLLVCLSHMFGRHPIISTIPQSQGGYRHLSMISLARSFAHSFSGSLIEVHHGFVSKHAHPYSPQRLRQTQLSYIPSYYKYHPFGSCFCTLANHSHIFIVQIPFLVLYLVIHTHISIFQNFPLGSQSYDLD